MSSATIRLRSGIRTIIASRGFLEKAKLGKLLQELPGVRVIYLEDLRRYVSPAVKLWVLWHRLFPRAASAAQRPDEAAVVLFTSGSEGNPKGVVHSHASLLSNMGRCARSPTSRRSISS